MFDKLLQVGDNVLYTLLSFDTPLESFWYFFKNGGWFFVLIAVLWGFKEMWLYWRQNVFYNSRKYVLLAIDVPRENEQGPKAIENLFSQIHGAHKSPDLIEKYWDGFLPNRFSFEIISIGGYLQFLIYTSVKFRDLVEAAIYAQYPDAEITEVDDYAKEIPSKFRDTEDDMWGCEFVLYNKSCYPIRTYPSFEYGLTQEFKDPMASTLEVMSKISPEENMLIQFVVTPILGGWAKKGQELVKKLIGSKTAEKKPGFVHGATAGLAKGVWETATYSVIPPVQKQEKKQNQEQRSEMLYLSPGERAEVEAIESKISKNGFDVKFRYIYWGKRGIYSRARGVNGMLGAIKQVNTIDLNGFKPHPKTKTRVYYFFIKIRTALRQQRLMTAFKSRSNWLGWGHSILNIEELATLWHFPMRDIRTPMLKKTQAKRMESPFALPIENHPPPVQAAQDSGLTQTPAPPATEELPSQPQPVAEPPLTTETKPAPPNNLPI